MRIGYARTSTSDQCLDLQIDELKKAGCEKIYSDVASGSKSDRPELKLALANLRKDDVLVVWKMDRLGRSLKHLLDTVTVLQARGVGFRSLTQNLDTTTAGGMLIFHVFGAVAEFERELIRERTRAGLDSARSRGRLGGRPKAMDPKKEELVSSLYDSKKLSIAAICETAKISKATLYRYIAARNRSMVYQSKDHEP